MSRALDRATVAALQSGDAEAAYRAIADVLSPSSASARLELEFLGREYLPLPEDSPYFLRDGAAVAIPKLALVLAFVVARRLLQKMLSAGSTGMIASDKDAEREKLRATAVILMMDPEHLTAANTRKRIMQERMVNSSDTAATGAVVAGELWLIDSFLTGHLHRHTKSPTLWNHRRWLLAFAASQKTREPVSVNPLRDIVEVVMVAAERHPRNYYAWDHARWLVRAAETHEGQNKLLVVAVRDWCYRHHTDTSGWSFLMFLLTSAHLRDEKGGPTQPVSPLLAETVTQVEQMATSLRWAGEAVWVFLRTAVAYTEITEATEATGSSHARFQKTAASLQEQVEPGSREHQILQQAQDWCAAKIEVKTSG